MAITAHAFDTLSYARRLKEAGVDEAQAEAHAEAVRDAVTEGVATKADIARIVDKMATKADLAALRADFHRAMFGLAAFIAGVAGVAIGLMQVLG